MTDLKALRLTVHGSGAITLFWLQSGMGYLTDPVNAADEQQTVTHRMRNEFAELVREISIPDHRN